MNRKLIIIICVAVILVAIIVGACIIASSNSTSAETTDWTLLENDSSYEVNWKNDSKGRMLLRITGDFAKDTFSIDGGDAFSASVDSSKKGKVTFLLEGQLQGTNNVIIRSSGDSSEKYTLMASYDGETVSPADFSYSSMEVQTFAGDIEGYAYTLTNDGSQMTLRITGAGDLNFEILHGTGNLFDVQNVLDAVEGDSEKDIDVPKKTAEINYDEEEAAESAEETEAPAAESTDAAPTDVSFVFTAKTSGFEAIKVCSSQLTHAIEIGASYEVNGYISVSSVDVIDYSYIEADTSALNDYESSVYALLVGEDMVPSNLTISGTDVLEDSGTGVLEIYLYSADWNYAVTDDMEEAELVKAVNSAAKADSTGTADEVEYTIYTAATGVYASFTYNENTCLVYSTDTTESDAAVQAVSAIISALEKD